jgi:hypothetical protein
LDYDNRPNPDGNINDIGWKWLSQHLMLNKLAAVNFVNDQGDAPSGNVQLQGGGQLAAKSKPFRSNELEAVDDFAPPKPTISEVEAKITVDGTLINDNVLVNYVVAEGGAVSVAPTPWIRVQATNANGVVVDYFETASVTLVCFNGYPGNDVFSNQTAIPSNARIRNIAGIGNPGYATRLNKDTFIKRGITLNNDGAVDTLLGEGGRDVFFSEFPFDVTDAIFNEAIFS